MAYLSTLKINKSLAPASKTSYRFAGSSDTEYLGRFERFRLLMEKLYGVTLSSVDLSSARLLSQFCTGLIEGDLDHPWRRSVGALSAQNRLGFKHSLFLFRKVIPKERPSVDEYVSRLSQPQEDPDADFLAYAKKLVRKIFPQGWDKSYIRHTLSSSLPLTSSSEVGRAEGGSRGWDSKMRWDRSEFCQYVLDSQVPLERGVARVSAVDTGGKWRVIASPPKVDNALRPLHKAVYSHLSRFGWLLRGDAKPNKFKQFTPVEGEVFVSGDYESATDNLNSVLQKAILSELLASSDSVPPGIKEHALQTYSSTLTCAKRGEEGRVVTQHRGQLMGQLTSFPLLCLVNYITFKYSIPRKGVPVKINGDDIVFRATTEEYETWCRNVAKGGLTLCKGKTFVHRRGFTLNSTPFWASKGGAKSVGFLRPSALWKKDELSARIQSLHGRFYSCCAGFGRKRRDEVRRFFLFENQRAIHASRRSVTRGLGLAVDRNMLHSLGLWHRELYYLEQVVEKPVPQMLKGAIPSGWRCFSEHIVPVEDRQYWSQEWSWACVEHAWVADFDRAEFTEVEKMRQMTDGCPPYGLGSLIGPKVRRMLKMTRSKIWKWVYRRQNESVFGRVQRSRGKGVWLKVDQLATRSLVTYVNFQAALL
nr:MAG: RNA-dependent RNA polymerase [Botourmiaviridae sp.]